jgi:riboflavin kinase/FMN adenylyltransferase
MKLRVKEILEEKGKTKYWLYIQLGLSYQNFSRMINGETVSSSAIRRSTAAGYLEHARAMLGRPVRIFGKVQHGNKVAGSVLEAPTANIDVAYGVLPPDGVYSGRVNINGVMCPAAVNIGFSPTFQVNRRRVEAHVLDFSGSLYGMELELELLDFLREEKSFSSPEFRLRRYSPILSKT